MTGIPKNILPVGLLMKEHRLIEKMVRVIDGKIKEYKGSGRPDGFFINGVVDFFKVYADKNHHGKEEEILFARLENRDITLQHRAIMQNLLRDHVQSRKIVGKIRELNAGIFKNSPQAIDEVIAHLQTLASLYTNHIDVEDNHFFLPVMGYFSKVEQEKMIEDFIDFDRQFVHNHYRDFVSGFLKGTEGHAI
ncbi:MAG: hemerythrin domain-containing protein [Candidatus Omnitrophota bacterium]